MNNLFDLTGKVAVVTGASSGIGVQIAKAFAEYGADLAILARRYERLESLASEIAAMRRKVFPVKCDVTKEEDVKAAVQAIIDKFGKIDILMNNAGVASQCSLDELEEAEWDRILNTNLKGIFLMTKYVVRHMKERRYGKIINTASIYGLIGSKSSPTHAYQASKGAVISLTRGLAASWAQYGITVNAIAPSLFYSEMTEKSLFKEENLRMYNAICPAGRPGKPGELNGAAIYFASDASSYTTGQTLFIDGGWSAV